MTFSVSLETISKDKISRYFTADAERIKSGGKTFAMTKMWGGDVTSYVDKVLAALPIPGIRCVRCEDAEV